MIQTAKNVVLSANDEGAVLLNKQSGIYYRLNSVGVLIYKLVAKGNASEGAIVAEIERTYPDATDGVAHDVHTLIHDLEIAGLVTIS